MAHTETTLNSQTIFSGRIIEVKKDDIQLENGKKSIREVVVHHGGVCVAAIDQEDRLLLVRQFRYPYGNPIVVQLLTDLKIALGYFLLIVPGIYWTYCYMLVPYLLAENPYMSATRAMELSKEMMEGEKWNFFILKLSFFGWLLLCVFTFGIGGFFLEPYMQATYAEFYAAMRSKALAMGMTTTDELGGFVRHDTYPNDMDF